MESLSGLSGLILSWGFAGGLLQPLKLWSCGGRWKHQQQHQQLEVLHLVCILTESSFTSFTLMCNKSDHSAELQL